MKETIVYIYCEAHAEIKLNQYPDIAALKRDHETILERITTSEPFNTMEFDNEEDAVDFMEDNFPMVDFSGKMGNAVPYVIATGAYVNKVGRLLDENGDIVNEWLIEEIDLPVFPPDTVMNSRGCEVDFDAAVNTMDDEIREELNRHGIEDPQEFFNAYAEAHEEKFDEEWAPYASFAW